MTPMEEHIKLAANICCLLRIVIIHEMLDRGVDSLSFAACWLFSPARRVCADTVLVSLLQCNRGGALLL